MGLCKLTPLVPKGNNCLPMAASQFWFLLCYLFRIGFAQEDFKSRIVTKWWVFIYFVLQDTDLKLYLWFETLLVIWKIYPSEFWIQETIKSRFLYNLFWPKGHQNELLILYVCNIWNVSPLKNNYFFFLYSAIILLSSCFGLAC